MIGHGLLHMSDAGVKLNRLMEHGKHDDWREAVLDTSHGSIREWGPGRVLSDHATAFMMRHMVVPRGARAVDAGCGTGVLAIFMALAGASRVIGTDIDRASLEAARYNAAINNINNAEFLEGSLLDPVSGPVDLVAALLPHKPAPRPFDHRYYGGEDGTGLVIPLIDEARRKLAPGGKLYLYLNGIANPKKVLTIFHEGFETHMVAEKKRPFTREEFDSLTEGMFEHLVAMRDKGMSEFFEDEEGLYFMARIWKGALR